MNEPLVLLALTMSGLAGLGIVAFAGLRGWRDWLDVERLRIAGRPAEPGAPTPAARIELADLKERIRKLEAIAAGIDL